MLLILIALLPFLGALVTVLLRPLGGHIQAAAAMGFTAVAFVLLVGQAPAVLGGETLVARLEWVPALGLNANFFLDPL